jgi:hypothetical protein
MADGINSSNPDCTLSVKGLPNGSINVPLAALDFGPNVVATEDQGRDNRIFYPRQVQMDMFSISAIFTRKARPPGSKSTVVTANEFSFWLRRYVNYVCANGSLVAMGVRVQVPARGFDMTGFPVEGWSYGMAPVQVADVAWVVTVNFDGAGFTGMQILPPSSAYAGASYYGAPAAPDTKADQLMFYPSYYDQTNGINPYTANPADALYGLRTPPKMPITKLFPTDKQSKKPFGPPAAGFPGSPGYKK